MSGNKVKCPISAGNLNFLLCSENFRRGLCWRHCKYKEWVSFFLGSWDMNRSAEQTNRTRTASRFTRFVCSALRFISHEPRKKDTHSLNELVILLIPKHLVILLIHLVILLIHLVILLIQLLILLIHLVILIIHLVILIIPHFNNITKWISDIN